MLWIKNFIKGAQTSAVDTRNSRKHKKKHVKVFFTLLFFMSDHSSKTNYKKKYRMKSDSLISSLFLPPPPTSDHVCGHKHGIYWCLWGNGWAWGHRDTSDTQELTNHGRVVVPINYKSLTQKKQFCFSRFQICEFGVSQIFNSAWWCCPDSYCQFWWIFSPAMGLLWS